jgi:DNA-binding transcriptional regulator GbsR (MarR family)
MKDSAVNTSDAKLAPWEHEVLDVFVGMFETFGLPKSIAMIYGVLYCSDTPLYQEEICQRLEISAGSASQGLRLLTSIGTVHRQSPVGQRQSVYTAERSMRRLLGYFIDVQLRPRLKTGRERLEQIQADIPEEDDVARTKIGVLLDWQRKADRALPLVSTLFTK